MNKFDKEEIEFKRLVLISALTLLILGITLTIIGV